MLYYIFIQMNRCKLLGVLFQRAERIIGTQKKFNLSCNKLK